VARRSAVFALLLGFLLEEAFEADGLLGCEALADEIATGRLKVCMLGEMGVGGRMEESSETGELTAEVVDGIVSVMGIANKRYLNRGKHERFQRGEANRN
jgi:hypothetical protein